MKMFCKNKSSELVYENGRTKLLYDKEDILFFVVGFATPFINLISLIIGSVILDVNYMVNMAGYPDMESMILPYLAIAIQTFFGFAIIYRQPWAALIQLICRIINLLASFFLLLIPYFYTLEVDPLKADPLKIFGLIKAASIFGCFVDNISTTLVLQIVTLVIQIVMIVLTSVSVNKLLKYRVPSIKIITYEKDHSMFLWTGLFYILGELILGMIVIIIAVMPYILSLLFKIDDFKTVIGGFDLKTLISDFDFEKVLVMLKTVMDYFRIEIIFSLIYLFIRLFFGIGIIIKKRWVVLWVRTFMIIGLFVNFFIFLVRMASASNWIDLLPVLTALIYVAYDIVMIVLTSSIAKIFDYDVQNYRMRVRDRYQ